VITNQLPAKEQQPDDVVTFLHVVEDRLPKLTVLVKAYIGFLVASVDVERSFSKYGSVLSCPVSTAPESLSIMTV